ncbi:MAG: hypothetical protein RL701_7079 [Pseudomonadota bacterium]
MMRRALWWLSALALLFTQTRASAHSLSLSALTLAEVAPGEFIASWEHTHSVSDPALTNLLLKPQFPPQCQFAPPKLSCGAAGLSGQFGLAGLGELSVTGMVHVHWLSGERQSFTLSAAQPSVRITAPTTNAPASAVDARAINFLWVGLEHIWLGWDHLLFVLGLFWLVRTPRMLPRDSLEVSAPRLVFAPLGTSVDLNIGPAMPRPTNAPSGANPRRDPHPPQVNLGVVKTISAFTLAHSLTLCAATFGYRWLPSAPVEAVIALSIAFVAVEIAQEARSGKQSFAGRNPWLVAFVFGLLHGFGFASALAELELAPANIPAALLFFNVGVELGQLVFVALLFASRYALRMLGPSLRQRGSMVGYYALGGLAMYWFFERLTALG